MSQSPTKDSSKESSLKNLSLAIKAMSIKKTQLFFAPPPNGIDNPVSDECLKQLGIPVSVTGFFPYDFQAFGSATLWEKRLSSGSIPFREDFCQPFDTLKNRSFSSAVAEFSPSTLTPSSSSTASISLFHKLQKKLNAYGDSRVTTVGAPVALWDSKADPSGENGVLVSAFTSSRGVRSCFWKITESMKEDVDSLFFAMSKGYLVTDPYSNRYLHRGCRLINKYSEIPGMTCYTLLVGACENPNDTIFTDSLSPSSKALKANTLAKNSFFLLIWVCSENDSNPRHSIATNGGISWMESCVSLVPNRIINTPWGDRKFYGRLELSSEDPSLSFPVELDVSPSSRVNWRPAARGPMLKTSLESMFGDMEVTKMPNIPHSVTLCTGEDIIALGSAESDLSKYVRAVLTNLNKSRSVPPFSSTAEEWSAYTGTNYLLWDSGSYTSSGRLEGNSPDSKALSIEEGKKMKIETTLRKLIEDSNLATSLSEASPLADAFKKLFS